MSQGCRCIFTGHNHIYFENCFLINQFDQFFHSNNTFYAKSKNESQNNQLYFHVQKVRKPSTKILLKFSFTFISFFHCYHSNYIKFMLRPSHIKFFYTIQYILYIPNIIATGFFILFSNNINEPLFQICMSISV